MMLFAFLNIVHLHDRNFSDSLKASFAISLIKVIFMSNSLQKDVELEDLASLTNKHSWERSYEMHLLGVVIAMFTCLLCSLCSLVFLVYTLVLCVLIHCVLRH